MSHFETSNKYFVTFNLNHVIINVTKELSMIGYKGFEIRTVLEDKGYSSTISTNGKVLSVTKGWCKTEENSVKRAKFLINVLVELEG